MGNEIRIFVTSRDIEGATVFVENGCTARALRRELRLPEGTVVRVWKDRIEIGATMYRPPHPDRETINRAENQSIMHIKENFPQPEPFNFRFDPEAVVLTVTDDLLNPRKKR